MQMIPGVVLMAVLACRCSSTDADDSSKGALNEACRCKLDPATGAGETSLACLCGTSACSDQKTFLERICDDSKPHEVITKEQVYADCHLSVFTNPDRNGLIRYVFDTTTGGLVGYAGSTDTPEECSSADPTMVAGTLAGQHEVPASCVLSMERDPCVREGDAGGSDGGVD